MIIYRKDNRDYVFFAILTSTRDNRLQMAAALIPLCSLPIQHHQLPLPVLIQAQCLSLPRRSIRKIHLLYPLWRLSPHQLRTTRTWSPRFPPGSPPSPQSNRWNQIPHSCQSLFLWPCGILISTERTTPSQRCSKRSKPSSFHSPWPTPTDCARSATRKQTEWDATDLATVVWPLLPSKSPPRTLDTFPPSLSLCLALYVVARKLFRWAVPQAWHQAECVSVQRRHTLLS